MLSCTYNFNFPLFEIFFSVYELVNVLLTSETIKLYDIGGIQNKSEDSRADHDLSFENYSLQRLNIGANE